ncbi:hypothetical protein PoB_002618300 [Plakobranchus ocellatus]|uniref:Uncharacterized protein n=1 Tax=Plakobranchus ocellatus TaxID=259542 RepID=A0AAV3ZXS1_9GAST|nr:hypothetical protein PoB_002618300 [Plakobranchus ocellatus]
MAYRFRAVLHRVLSQSAMNAESLNPNDDSRPNFVRPECCVGIYIDAIDARPDKSTTVGSQHAFMMVVMDKLLDHLRTLPLNRIKGDLELRHAGSGIILDGFKHSCVLAVTCDDEAGLQKLWELHQQKRLTPLFQDILVDKSTLKAVGASKMTLRAKMWEDEYVACRQELAQRSALRLKLSSFANDLGEVQHVKSYQKNAMSQWITQARDHESQLETHLGDFMLSVKRALPPNATVIKNVKEFATNMKMAKGLKSGSNGFDYIDKYLAALEFFKKAFADVEKNIVRPLAQVRTVCESDKQRNLKKVIRSACAEMQANLKPDADLQKIRFKDWGQKMVQREHGLFYGLISLVPMSLDRLSTIDVTTDEYVADFPDLVS